MEQHKLPNLPVTILRITTLFLIVFVTSSISTILGSNQGIEYTLHLDYSCLSIEEATVGNGTVYSHINLNDLKGSNEPGSPDIPEYHISFLVPSYSKDFNISVLSKKLEITKTLDYDISPIQEEYSMNSKDIKFTVPDYAKYKIKSEIGAKIISEQFFEGWQHIVTVAIIPIEYDYYNKLIRCFSDIKIYLEYSMCEAKDMTSPPVFPPNPQYSPLISQIVINPPHDNIQNRISSVLYSKPIKDGYIILTSEDLKEEFERLAIWKRQKGYKADVVTVESILSLPEYQINEADSIWDKAAAIRKWLKTKYQTFGHYFLLLAGDSRNNKIPIRKYHMTSIYRDEYGDSVIPSDVYFVDFTDAANNLKKYPNGLYSKSVDSPVSPALPVGRLICSKKQEVSNYIRKLQIYEAWPGKGDMEYLNRGAVFTQQDGVSIKNGVYSKVKDIFNQLTDYISCTSLIDTIRIDNFLDRRPTGEQVINSMQNVGLMSWQGHGQPGSIGCAGKNKKYDSWRYIQPTKYITDTGLSHQDPNNSLDLLNNDYKPSVAYSLSCTIMPFDFAYHKRIEYNMGSAFTVAGKYGGVALLGNTRDGSWSQSAEQENFFGAIIKNNRKIGIAENLTKIMPNALIGDRYRYTHNLVGDPEFELWLGKPGINDVKISTNSNKYTVSGKDLKGCIISAYNGISLLRSDSVIKNISSIQFSITDNTTLQSNLNQDILISVWRTGMLPVMKLVANNVLLKDVTKTYLLPVINLCNSDSDPCKLTMLAGSTLNLISATDIIIDGSLALSGGDICLEGENVTFKGNNNFNNDGNIKIIADTISIEGDFEITNCSLEINCD